MLNSLLGLDASQLNLWQIALRAAIVYILALIILRLGDERRFSGKYAAFDVILGIILGATLSNAITGTAPFFPTLTAGIVLVIVHWLVAELGFRFEAFDRFIKGTPHIVIKDGETKRKAMATTRLSKQDLEAIVRTEGKLSDLSQVYLACVEKSGDVSVIPEKTPPQIIEVTVESGVQTIKIQLD
ncbi:MAG: YetF domain-containing protein [Spirulinaceae cyanobacterium]